MWVKHHRSQSLQAHLVASVWLGGQQGTFKLRLVPSVSSQAHEQCQNCTRGSFPSSYGAACSECQRVTCRSERWGGACGPRQRWSSCNLVQSICSGGVHRWQPEPHPQWQHTVSLMGGGNWCLLGTTSSQWDCWECSPWCGGRGVCRGDLYPFLGRCGGGWYSFL